MQNFYRNFQLPKDQETRLLGWVRSFKMSIGIIDESEIDGDDPRLEWIHELAGYLDAVLFVPNGQLLNLVLNRF
ncbi:MAG: hypothetical protein AAF585_06195 [Verrucomicrobiota bacterium]